MSGGAAAKNSDLWITKVDYKLYKLNIVEF